MCLCTGMCMCVVRYLQWPEEDIRCPGTEVTGELPNTGSGNLTRDFFKNSACPSTLTHSLKQILNKEISVLMIQNDNVVFCIQRAEEKTRECFRERRGKE